MPCARCQHSNPPGQKFCGNCGVPLTASCPTCHSPNPIAVRRGCEVDQSRNLAKSSMVE